MAQMVEVRFIKRHEGHEPGETKTVKRGEAAILEARKVAIRERKSHNTKPIDERHTVTKGE